MVDVHQDHDTKTHHLPQGDAHWTQIHYTWLISRLEPWKVCQLACLWWPRKMLHICMVGRRRPHAAHAIRLHTIPLAIICSSLAIRFPSKLKPDDGPGLKDVPSLLTFSGQWCFPVLLSTVCLFPVQTPILLFTQSQGIPHEDIKFICLNNHWMRQQHLGAWKMKAWT